MKTFARIRSTVRTNIESFVDQLENQEAVATATTANLERAVVRLRVHRKHAEGRAEGARDGMRTLEETARAWRDRAVRLGDDRERAIECVRRFRATKRSLGVVAAELLKEERLIEKIARDEGALSAQVDTLKHRCASLASRQVRSEAARDFEADEGASEIFERWETRVEAMEAAVVAGEITRDSFAGAFDEEEDRAELERELDDLCRSGVSS
jgi:hypothetical protein